VAFRPVTLSSEAGDPQQAPRAGGAEGTGEAGNGTGTGGTTSDGTASAGTPAQDSGNPSAPALEEDGNPGASAPEDDGNPGARLPEDGANPQPLPSQESANPGPPLPEDGGAPGVVLPQDGGNPGAALPEDDGSSNVTPPEDGGSPGLPLPVEGGNPGLLLSADGGDSGLLLPAGGSPSPPPPAPTAESARPHAPGRHRRRRPQAHESSRRRLHAALTALAAFLVIAAVVLVATDNGAPPAPNSTAAQPGPITEPNGQIAPPPNYKLAFSTDFPGTALDTSTWAQCYPWSPAPPGCSNFGNADEREWYLPSQVHVDNGLALVAQRIPTQGSDEDGNPKVYTCRSGMVTTYPSVHLKYGFVQVTARLPFGKGLWPAIWLIPADQSWPPEIDIVEHWDTQPTASATLHYGKQNSQQRGTVNFPDADKGWHTYTLYWTQSRITIYYDNQLALTTTAHIPQQTMYLLLDLADENDTPGSCSGTMYVKSVNIWKPSPTPATG
jgi:hypothetical protein